MNDGKTTEQNSSLDLEFDLDEPPQKVWRAVSIPAFRENWLPKQALADPEATTIIPDQQVRYTLRDEAPPYLESTVTFTISPNMTGGTLLRIVQELTDARLVRTTIAAANTNSPISMLAA